MERSAEICSPGHPRHPSQAPAARAGVGAPAAGPRSFSSETSALNGLHLQKYVYSADRCIRRAELVMLEQCNLMTERSE